MQQQHYLEDALENRAVVVGPEEGEHISAVGGEIFLKITSDMTKDQLGIYEIRLQPGVTGAQLHYHQYMDETFIVTKGKMTVQVGDKEITGEQGAVVYVPRMTPHGFSNKSDEEAVIMLLFNPGQSREGFFRGLGEILSETPVDAGKFLKLYQKYDSYPVDAGNFLPRRG